MLDLLKNGGLNIQVIIVSGKRISMEKSRPIFSNHFFMNLQGTEF
jgi:hypothetical protein